MKYDLIICGGGVAGLWLLNTLTERGFNVVLIEKDALGGAQTLASQGMIHGGQKYLLQGRATPEARSIAKMPEYWQRCLEGTGQIDLSKVAVLSDTQVMWPAGSVLSEVGLIAAAKLVNAQTKKLHPTEHPSALQGGTKYGSIYELPEKVLDTRSLISALSAPHEKRIVKGTITSLDRNGEVMVDGMLLQAQLIIFTAGIGNEEALRMLGESVEDKSQRRPLRQIMVRSLDSALYGHGVIHTPKPRVTVTSHPLAQGTYVWYLGGALAEHTASLTDEEAIAHAKQEMQEIFRDIDWSTKEWATWAAVRAEARHPNNVMKDGPAVQEYGNVLVAWPTKITFVPALSDAITTYIDSRRIAPLHTDEIPPLPHPEIGRHPWETADWK